MFSFIFTVLVCLFYALPHVHGFCIYNHSKDATFFIRQAPLNTSGTYWSRFKVPELTQNEKACCSYTSPDCNKSGGRDDQVQLAFSVKWGGTSTERLYSTFMPAGGWLEFHSGGPREPDVRVFKPNGERYNNDLRDNIQGLLLN